MVHISIVIAIIALVWLINRWIIRDFVKLAYQVPSNKWHTFWGWGKIIRPKDVLSYLYTKGNKYGPNYVAWLGPFPLFITSDPETIKTIFTSKNCVNKPLIMDGITWSLGTGLLTANESIWTRHHKVLTKSFSHKNIVSFLSIFQYEINNLIQEIDKEMEKGENMKNLLPIIRQITLKTSIRTMLKSDLELTDSKLATLTNNFNDLLAYAIECCVNIFLRIKFIRQLANKFLYKNIVKSVSNFRKLIDDSLLNLLENRNRDLNNNSTKMNSTLEYALNGVERNLMEVEEISDEMMHLFVASFETTSTTLYFVIIMLAMHPKYQESMFEEVKNTLTHDSVEMMTIQQLDELTYLDMLVNETMRVLPIVPLIPREVANENVKLNNDVELGVGQSICIDTFSLHRCKDIWGPNAELFNPDNFLPSNIASRHPFSFIPFGKGLRFCIGWRYATYFLKVSLVTLIKNYKFSTDFKYENLRFENHLTLKLVEEPEIHIEPRDFNIIN
ncbi:putative cytochrome P450 313a4 [Cochliomyia hominivorax]